MDKALCTSGYSIDEDSGIAFAQIRKMEATLLRFVVATNGNVLCAGGLHYERESRRLEHEGDNPSEVRRDGAETRVVARHQPTRAIAD